MPNLFSLITDSWRFCRKQPALRSVLLWLFIVPITAENVLLRLIDPFPPLLRSESLWPYQGILRLSPPIVPFVALIVLMLVIVITWGTACVLVVGKRMIQSKAGRARTSFAALRREGAQYVAALFLTDILRSVFTVFWGLLLVFPGIVYATRTAFFDVAIVTEESGYRAALRRSKEVVTGDTGIVFLYFLGLAAILFLPAAAAALLVERAVSSFNPVLIPVSDLLASTLMGFATMLYTLASVSLFGALRRKRQSILDRGPGN